MVVYICSNSDWESRLKQPNRWKILWRDKKNKPVFKKFEDIKEAVAFGKDLRTQGLTPALVSSRKAYAPTEKAGPRPDSKHFWCPYCIKWRVFTFRALRRSWGITSVDKRCTVCTISMADFFVRKYNGYLAMSEEEIVRRLRARPTVD